MEDIDIARSIEMNTIDKIAKELNIDNNIEYYGNYKAKINGKYSSKNGKLILVTATSPTKFGEGKTTISVGLLDAFKKLNYSACASLREPSLGPVFGMKGGATGGGYSQVVPMEDLNLNFTGDFHAITAANNLLCSAIDNHIYQGNLLDIDINKIVFNRCLDINDRALKNLTINSKNYNRIEKFDITAASEIMAILCLATDIEDLRKKIDNILIAYSKNNKPIFAKDLNVTGAMITILKDAIKPNLVQTLEHNPVIIHGGPFANIAHGCSSIIATNTSLSLADYTITEAGFGSDLGALKFFDIKCRNNDIMPDATVLVTTIKALKYNGNDDLNRGLLNLEAHIDILHKFTENIVVCLNKFSDDTDDEIKILSDYCNNKNILFSISTSYKDGGVGSIDLAKKIISINRSEKLPLLYDVNDTIQNKIKKILSGVLCANNVIFDVKALEKINDLEMNHLDNKPIVIAKTQYSISDDKNKLGYPKNYDVFVNDVKVYNGAGFITVYLGDIITMPGLPKNPNYEKINIIDNNIVGIF